MSQTTEMLWNLSDIKDAIDAQRTGKLDELEAEYKTVKAKLTKHIKAKSRKHVTVCAGDDCRVMAVAKVRTSNSFADAVALARQYGATDEEIEALTTSQKTWAIG